jgi:hypothetical protein
MITYAEASRSCDSDESATVPAVDDLAERGIRPKELQCRYQLRIYRKRNRVRETRHRTRTRPSRGRRSEEPSAEGTERAITKADFQERHDPPWAT